MGVLLSSKRKTTTYNIQVYFLKLITYCQSLTNLNIYQTKHLNLNYLGKKTKIQNFLHGDTNNLCRQAFKIETPLCTYK